MMYSVGLQMLASILLTVGVVLYVAPIALIQPRRTILISWACGFVVLASAVTALFAATVLFVRLP